MNGKCVMPKRKPAEEEENKVGCLEKVIGFFKEIKRKLLNEE